MKADWMASISFDLSGGSGSVECQANFNFQVSLVYFPNHVESLAPPEPRSLTIAAPEMTSTKNSSQWRTGIGLQLAAP